MLKYKKSLLNPIFQPVKSWSIIKCHPNIENTSKYYR